MASNNEANGYEALIRLAYYKQSSGQVSDATVLCQRAIEIAPDRAAAHLALGECHLKAGLALCAIDALERAAELDLESGPLHRALGLAYRRAGRADDAITAFERATMIEPEDPENFLRLEEQLRRAGRLNDAIWCLERAISKHTTAKSIIGALASLYGAAGRNDEAEELFRQGLSLDPSSGQLYALWLRKMGRFEESRTLLADSVRLEPVQGLAYYGLAEERQFAVHGQPLLGKMLEVSRVLELNQRERMFLNYAIGMAHESESNYQHAMRYYDQAAAGACELYKSGSQFDVERLRRRSAALIQAYDARQVSKIATVGSTSDLPIFIVGMIRSGTTLLERMLAAHSSIAAGGELDFWQVEGNRLHPSARTNLNKEEVAATADNYLAQLRQIDRHAARVTDKMPLNYAYLGLLHTVFPHARILHVRRNPLDTCLSIYTTHFGGMADFAYDRGNIAADYKEYMRLTGHWREVLPKDRYFELDYEDLVSRPSAVIREVILFCGLEWDEACLKPEESAGVVHTPSRWQARQPIYQSSIDRWRKFEPWLGELLELKCASHPPANEPRAG